MQPRPLAIRKWRLPIAMLRFYKSRLWIVQQSPLVNQDFHHGLLSAPATRRILEREYQQYHKPEYE